MIFAREKFLMGLERKQQAQAVCGHKQHGEADAELLRHPVASCQIEVGDRGRREERNRGHQQQCGMQPASGAIVVLDVVSKPAEQEGRPKHKQRVGNDRAGDRGLHEHVFSGAKGGYRDNQLCQIAQCRIEQSADRVTRPFCDRLGRVTEKRRERHDRQHGKDKKGRVSRWRNRLQKQHCRYEDEHPQQWAVPDFLEQRVHRLVWLPGSKRFACF
jgi:hypothetical protein